MYGFVCLDRMDAFVEHLSSLLLEKPDLGQNFDRNALISLIADLSNKRFPKQMIRRTQLNIAKNPWIFSRILKLVKTKSKLYTEYLKDKRSNSFAKNKKFKNELTYVKEYSKT